MLMGDTNHYLKQWRIWRGLTLAMVAERTHITHASISRIERGLQPYSQSSLQKFAQAYDCDPSDLLMVDPTKAEGSIRGNAQVETDGNNGFSSATKWGSPSPIRERIEMAVSFNEDMTYRKLSLLSGLSDSMMHKYMTNFTQSMSIDRLISVAEALHVDPRWLIFGDKHPTYELAEVWEKISDSDKSRVLVILRSFAETSGVSDP